MKQFSDRLSKGRGSQTEAKRCDVQIQPMKSLMDISHPLETCTSLVRSCSKIINSEKTSLLT